MHTQKDKAGEALQAMKDENREHGEDEAVLEVVDELLVGLARIENYNKGAIEYIIISRTSNESNKYI